MAIVKRDRETIRAEVLATIQEFKTNVDISISTTTNAVATGIVYGAASPLWNDLYREYVNIVLKDPNQLDSEGILDQAILEDYGRINDIFRKSATQATGEVVFVLGGAPTRPIVVPAGTVVAALISSSGNLVRFTTTASVSVDPNDPAAYFIPELSNYGIRAPVRAVDAGTIGNRTPGSISILITPLVGILDVTNLEATDGGKEIESNLDYALRIEQERNRPVGISQVGGISKFIQDQPDVEGVVLLRAGDPDIKRTTGNGPVDVYVKGLVEQVQTETFQYAGTDFIFSVQPVTRISYLRVGSTALIEGSGFQFIKDTISAYAGSARAQDKVRFLTPPNNGDIISIGYRVNSLPAALTNLVNSELNLTPGCDIVVFSAKAIPIYVKVSVRRDPASSTTVVATNVRNSVISYITTHSDIGESVLQSGILSAIQSAVGVLGIDLSTFQTRRLSDDISVNGDVTLTRLEYATEEAAQIDVTVLN